MNKYLLKCELPPKKKKQDTNQLILHFSPILSEEINKRTAKAGLRVPSACSEWLQLYLMRIWRLK